jgi:prepilin peptidase CpaA
LIVMPVPALPFIAAALVASIALVTDLRSRRIPNWLTASGLLLGLAGHLWLDGLSGGLSALGGAALGFGLLFPFYVMRIMGVGHAVGAGDVKLLAALGAILGPQALVSAAIYGALVGGLQSLVILRRQGRLGFAMFEMLAMHTVPTSGGATAPYAIAIAAGVYLSAVLPPVLRF